MSNFRASAVLRWTAAAPALPLFAIFAATHRQIVDDAFITFRYAQHWVETGRLTWHIGLPMVDGYTSLAHVVLIAVGIRLGFDPITFNACLNLGCVLGILAVYSCLCRLFHVGSWGRIVGLYLIVMNSGLAFWVSGGLDGLLWSLGVATIYLCFETSLARERFTGPLACSMLGLLLIRPEGTFIVIGLLLYLLAYLQRTDRLGWPALAPWLGLVMAGIIALYTWRLITYGHLLPNTFYAKGAASQWIKLGTGGRYLWLWFAFYGGVLGLSIFINLRRSLFANARAYFVLGYLLLVALEGGDPQQQMRFLLPLVPLLSLQVACVWNDGAFDKRVLVSVLAIMYAVQQFNGKEPWRNVWPLNESTRVEAFVSGGHPLRAVAAGVGAIGTGEWPLRGSNYEQWNAPAARHLARLLRDDVAIAATDVGALAYYSKLPVLDVQGLNHKAIAHLPKPAGFANVWGIEHWEVVLDADVDVIILGYLQYSRFKLTDLRIGALTEEQWVELFTRRLEYPFDRIAEKYICASVPDRDNGPRYLNFLIRRKGIDQLWRSRPSGVAIGECW
jgi:hypothetical protein